MRCFTIAALTFAAGNLESAAQGVIHSIEGQAAGDALAWSLADAGEVDGDGSADFIIGAPQEDGAGGIDSGTARLFSGRTAQPLLQFSGDSAGDEFGFSVAGAGDVNGDGFPDLAVGARYDDNTALDAGSARLLSGKDGSLLFLWNGDSAGDVFGHWSDGAGDVNADGVLDAVFGAEHDRNNGTNSGSARVFSGANGQQLLVLNGPNPFDCAGISVSGVGDLDGDLHDDVAVGIYRYDSGTLVDAGAARVHSGAIGGVLLHASIEHLMSINFFRASTFRVGNAA